jgi:hypothetical protein
MDEQELRSKYRSINIVKGSLRKGRGKHANKNVVDCVCKCGRKQTVASSDLWLKNCCGCGEKLNRARSRKAK